MKPKIGIYAGTFDPVHTGHITFALQALERAGLDMIYFLPERRPRHKKGVEHFGHRVAMLRRAIQPHPRFDVLELEDISFSVQRTLRRLESRFPNARLTFLFGSDTALNLPSWPHADRLLERTGLVIGCRAEDEHAKVEESIGTWPTQPESCMIFKSYAPQVSSRKVRTALQDRQREPGVLSSVEQYSNRNWLYVSLAQNDIERSLTKT